MIDVVMPKMGESITEGTILEWKKQVGDSINKDEALLEISTDKVDSEIPSPASGTIIEITAKVNETVPVGNIIARIGEMGESPTLNQDAKLDTEEANSKSTKGKSKDVEYSQETDMTEREEKKKLKYCLRQCIQVIVFIVLFMQKVYLKLFNV